jgi:hypothetical protein
LHRWPLDNEFHLNKEKKNTMASQDTLHFRYKGGPGNAAQEDNPCLFQEQDVKHKIHSMGKMPRFSMTNKVAH